MAHTNETPNYHLPQYVGTDIINPLVDTNGAYSDIDTALKDIADAEVADAGAIDALEATVGDNTAGLVKDVADLQAQNGNSVLTTDAQTLSAAINEVDAHTDTNTGNIADNALAITGLQNTVGNSNSGLVKDVADLQTTVGDAGSGLVKSVADNTARLNEFGTHLVPIDIETTFVNVTADGVKTYTEMLNELHSAMANYINNAPNGEYIKIDHLHIDGVGNFTAEDALVFLNDADMSTRAFTFDKVYTDGVGLFVSHSVAIKASASKFDYCSSDGTTMTFHAGETDVPANGVNFHLRGMSYKLI